MLIPFFIEWSPAFRYLDCSKKKFLIKYSIGYVICTFGYIPK